MRVSAIVGVISLASMLVAAGACTGGDGERAVVEVTDDCVGFTAHGPDLGDEQVLGDALAAWADGDAPGLDDPDELTDGAQVCVLYAGPDGSGDPVVTLASTDLVDAGGRGGVVTVQMGDDGGRVVSTATLAEGTPVVGVADGVWLVADRVSDAELYVGSATGIGVSSALAGQLIERDDPAPPHRDEDRILVATVDGQTFLATGATGSTDEPVLLPIADGPVALAEVLAAPGGVPLAASAVRNGVLPREPLTAGVELLGIAAIDGVGTVLASVSTDPLAGRGGTSIPAVQVAGEAGVRVNPYAPAPGDGWAVGLWLDVPVDEGEPATYLAVAHPPAGTAASDTELTVAAGSVREIVPGPMAVVTVPVHAGGDVTASIIATAGGDVIPTLAADDRLAG